MHKHILNVANQYITQPAIQSLALWKWRSLYYLFHIKKSYNTDKEHICVYKVRAMCIVYGSHFYRENNCAAKKRVSLQLIEIKMTAKCHTIDQMIFSVTILCFGPVFCLLLYNITNGMLWIVPEILRWGN